MCCRLGGGSTVGTRLAGLGPSLDAGSVSSEAQLRRLEVFKVAASLKNGFRARRSETPALRRTWSLGISYRRSHARGPGLGGQARFGVADSVSREARNPVRNSANSLIARTV